jgi:hypothetical protein
MAALKEHPAPAEPQSYIWSFPGAPIRIHLSLEVVESLAPRFRGKEGAAPFGLLLGHVDGLTTIVSGFQPLAAAEAGEIESALAKLAPPSGLSPVVGYYRGQPAAQQHEGLRLNEEDMSLARLFFSAPSNVVLLVQAAGPGPASATFFFRDGGHLNGDFPFLEFPFDAHLLAAAEQHRVEAAQRRSFGVLPPPPPPSPVRAKPRRQGIWKKGMAWALLAACAGGGAAVGVRYFLETSPWSLAIPAAAPQTAAIAPAPMPSLGLQAERQNADLKITWNRESAAISNATLGVISIKDGDSRRTISLEAAQVRGGSLLYTPVSDQVQMELAVATPTGNAAESVLVVLPTMGPARTVAIQRPVPVQPERPAPRSASRVQPAKPFTAPPAPPRQSAPSPAFSEPPTIAAGANTAPPAAAPLWSRPALTVQPPPAPVPAPVAAADPPPRRAIAVAPIYHAAEPIYKAQPIFPAALQSTPTRNTVTRPMAVEVLVSIDETGRVVKTDPKSQPGVHPLMVASALAAAKQWKFRPARQGDRPVPSEMLLRFNFVPVQ